LRPQLEASVMALTWESRMRRQKCQYSDGDEECNEEIEDPETELRWVDIDHGAREALIDMIVSILNVEKS